MDKPSQSNLKRALNEVTFRQRNTIIKQQTDSILPADSLGSFLVSFVCECADETCQQRVELSIPEYERVHRHPRRFSVAPGHAESDIERVVEEHGGYVVIEKFEPLPEADGRLRRTSADHA